MTNTDPIPAGLNRYSATISEYQLKEIKTPPLTQDVILAAIENQKAVPIETVMTTATDGIEGRIQFGRQVALTTGSVNNGRTNARQTQQFHIGTMLRLSIAPSEPETMVGVSLSFEAARVSGEGTEDSPPDIATTTITLKQTVELGKPTLIGASTANESSFVFLTISRL